MYLIVADGRPGFTLKQFFLNKRRKKNSVGRYSKIGVYMVTLVLSNFTYTLLTQFEFTTISAKYPEVALTKPWSDKLYGFQKKVGNFAAESKKDMLHGNHGNHRLEYFAQ